MSSLGNRSLEILVAAGAGAALVWMTPPGARFAAAFASALVLAGSLVLRRFRRKLDELASELALERERSHLAREQAWQDAVLGRMSEDLLASSGEDDLWETATGTLGRALDAARAVAYEKDARGGFRLRAQFVAEGVAPLDERSMLPGALVQDSDPALERDPEIRALAGPLGVRSLLVLPVARRCGETAALAIHPSQSPRAWSESERRFVQRFAEALARSLDHAALSRSLDDRSRTRWGLVDFARALAGMQASSSIADLAVSRGAPLAGASRSAVLVAQESGGFEMAAQSGFSPPQAPLPLSVLRPRLEQALRERATVRMVLQRKERGSSGPLAPLTLVPLLHGRGAVGVLVLECGEASWRTPGLDEEAAQVVAELVSTALEGARRSEALAASEGSYRLLLADSSSALLTLEETGFVREANAAASQLLGLTPAELTGTRLESLLVSESRSLWRTLESQLFSTGRLRDVTLKLRGHDGCALELLLDAAAAPGGGRARKARLLLRDATELKRLEHQLRQSQKLEVVGALAGGIAHDFNNVLGGILGYASLLRTHLMDRPVAAKYVETIVRSAVRGAELTGRLLSASRKVPARTEPVNLNLVIEETLELLAHSFHKSIRIEKRLDPEVRSILADASQLQQIVLNLCVNARDAMPEGGLLRVGTRVLASGRIQLSVEDTGVGMDAKTLGRLFEPFFSTKGSGGTGLGLSVVYGIVKSLGGEVGVKSSPGRGARFEVVLPCSWAEEHAGGGPLEEPIPGQGELILLVDDEKVLRDLGKDILETHGYRVATVSSGEEALDFLHDSEQPVSLIILDLVMPGLGGAETYRRLRGLDGSVPILLSSGLTAEETAQTIVDQGAAGFIPKPYGIGDLTRAVSEALRRRTAVVH